MTERKYNLFYYGGNQITRKARTLAEMRTVKERYAGSLLEVVPVGGTPSWRRIRTAPKATARSEQLWWVVASDTRKVIHREPLSLDAAQALASTQSKEKGVTMSLRAAR